MKLRNAALAAVLVCGLAAGSASASIVSVAGTAAPYDWTVAGIAGAMSFDATAATRVGVNAGDSITITYLDGLTGAFSDGLGNPGAPEVDGKGYQFLIFGSGAPFGGDPADPENFPPTVPTGIGSSGFPLPSFYLDPNNTGENVWLNALMGDFVDASGQVLSLFVINNGPVNFVAPTGAVALQLGVNDDLFGDNSGALRVQVDGSTFTAGVPEPTTWALMLSGFGLAGAALRARRRQAVTA